MKFLITIILTSLLTVSGAVLFFNKKFEQQRNVYELRMLNTLAVSVKKNFTHLASKVQNSSDIVSKRLSSDLDFAMKLTVEKDLSALEILESTTKLFPLSGLSFLELTDSSFRILSSAHEPSRVGNIDLDMKKIEDNTTSLIDIITKNGKQKLLAYKKPFKCAETNLYCISGIILDTAITNYLTPDSETTVLLKNGTTLIGGNVKSISDVKNNTIVINDSTYLVVTIPLYSDSSSLLVLRVKTKDGGIIDIF